jgi:hypothetical protein
MTREILLHSLKDFVEVRSRRGEWNDWWLSHAGEIESGFDRFTYLQLKCRGVAGAVHVLEREGVTIEFPEDLCRKCGEALFIAMPGETTREEIRAFAISSSLRAREEIARDGWIHPGKHCPNGCTQILWHIKRDAPEA